MQPASTQTRVPSVARLRGVRSIASLDVRIRRPNRRLIAALGTAAAATGASFLVENIAETETSLLLLVSVLLVGWYADLRSALVVVAVTSIALVLLVFEGGLWVETLIDVGRLAVYVLVATALAFLTSRVSTVHEERAGMVERVARANAQLVKANELKDEFVGLVSHELHSPLTVIRGNAEALARYGTGMDEQARTMAIRDIAAESSRLGDIVEDLLTLARLDRGLTLPIEPVLLNGVVARAVDVHRRRHPQREVRTDGLDERMIGVGVPVYVEQLTRNLLENAEKFSPPEAPIEIGVTRHADEIRLGVLDRGPGVPPEERDAIFTPFYRASTTPRSTRGFGVGLAVCHRMAEAQGGSIWLAEHAGGGAAFWFSIPAAEI